MNKTFAIITKPFETVMYRESNRKMINTTILMNRKCHIPVIFAEKKSLIYRKKRDANFVGLF